MKFILVTLLLVVPLLGCSDESPSEKLAVSYRHPAFDPKALEPTVDIHNKLGQVKIGAHASDLLKDLGRPNMWGHIEKNKDKRLGDFDINVSAMGPSSVHNHPVNDLPEFDWVYITDSEKFSRNATVLHFKQKKLYSISTGNIGMIYDP